MRQSLPIVLSVVVGTVLFAACASSSSTLAPMPSNAVAYQARSPMRDAASYSLLYAFKGAPDGNRPVAPLIVAGGTLYGTTQRGGSQCNSIGCGTVFAVNRAGAEHVLASFNGFSGGSSPMAGLLYAAGALYGTTFEGGALSDGTVFRVGTSGGKRVVYGFNGSTGALPVAGLTSHGGMLFGTTYEGGANAGGTVFVVTASGEEDVVYSFRRGSVDGSGPESDLIATRGNLYGSTFDGGTEGDGTVFAISTTNGSFGEERVVYSFRGGKDGARPLGRLLDDNGTLYGTTSQGGGAKNAGTVFSIDASGTERVLYRFKGKPDGASPRGGVILANGMLFGTTASGGARGQGSIFSLTANGKETLLYSFKGRPDGAGPVAGLVAAGNTLYGTTSSGGAKSDGTVFSIGI